MRRKDRVKHRCNNTPPLPFDGLNAYEKRYGEVFLPAFPWELSFKQPPFLLDEEVEAVVRELEMETIHLLHRLSLGLE